MHGPAGLTKIKTKILTTLTDDDIVASRPPHAARLKESFPFFAGFECFIEFDRRRRRRRDLTDSVFSKEMERRKGKKGETLASRLRCGICAKLATAAKTASQTGRLHGAKSEQKLVAAGNNISNSSPTRL
jgi:hypothetical protein